MEISNVLISIIEFGDVFFEKYALIGRSFLDVAHLFFDKMFYLALGLIFLISVIYSITTILVIFSKKNSYKEQKLENKNTPFVTVQIPTRNELAAINCAKRCLDFDYPKNKVEILIGDDSDDPQVSKELKAFASNYSNVHIHKRDKNLGYKAGNLNNLLDYSKGEYLVLFDSDFLPPRDFLRRIISPMVHDKKVVGSQARWSFVNANQNKISIFGAAIGSVFHHVALPFFNSRRRLTVLCGSAEAIKKDVLIELGGWKFGSLTEDIEYSLRLLKNGYKIQYLPDLDCECEVPHKPVDLYKQQMRWAYGVIDALKEHYKQLYTSKHLNAEDKFLISYVFSGYLFSSALFIAFGFGILSIITHEPSSINFGKFFFETTRNILFTAGLLFTSAYGLYKIGLAKKIGGMIVSSFTYGLIVTYYVNVGIFKVLTGKPMPWFLLNKNGNKNN